MAIVAGVFLEGSACGVTAMTMVLGCGGAGGEESDGGSGGGNSGRGVIVIGVDGVAVVRARGAGKAPMNGGIGFAGAGDGGAERLQPAEFDGRGNRRERDGDVAGDSDAGG